MTCPKCTLGNLAQALQCVHCGFQLRSPESAAGFQAQAALPDNDVLGKYSRGMRSLWIALFVIAALSALPIVLVVWLALTKRLAGVDSKLLGTAVNTATFQVLMFGLFGVLALRRHAWVNYPVALCCSLLLVASIRSVVIDHLAMRPADMLLVSPFYYAMKNIRLLYQARGEGRAP
jgi:hypothetical protein